MIPSYLEEKPNVDYSPPIESTYSELPLQKMSWENFERLCLRMVQEIEGFGINECEFYGKS